MVASYLQVESSRGTNISYVWTSHGHSNLYVFNLLSELFQFLSYFFYASPEKRVDLCNIFESVQVNSKVVYSVDGMSYPTPSLYCQVGSSFETVCVEDDKPWDSGIR